MVLEADYSPFLSAGGMGMGTDIQLLSSLCPAAQSFMSFFGWGDAYSGQIVGVNAYNKRLVAVEEPGTARNPGEKWLKARTTALPSSTT